jgi:type VI secretion system secreted protein VgrG
MTLRARPELHFHTSALDDPGSFRLVSLRGFEAISQLYELEIELELLSDVEPLDADTVESILREPAILGFADRGNLEHAWHGMVREMELLHAGGGSHPAYRAVIVPTLWYATQTVRTRVFLDQTVPDIVKKVLEDLGLASGDDFSIQLSGSYPSREYVVQYAESDLDFIARLMEHEGIFWFFEQRHGGEVLVVGDGNSVFRAPEEVGERLRFDTRLDMTHEGGSIHTISKRYRVVPQHVAVREYQHDQPRTPLSTSRVVHDGGFGLVMLHGENVPSAAEQDRICRVRTEERALERHVHHATSSVRGLHAGHRFTLEGHPFGELTDADLVVVAMRHFAEQGTRSNASDAGQAPFGSEIDLLPHDVPFRPARSTPRPRIDGVVHAKIDGDNGPAPIDDQGRYRVLLPFDSARVPGQSASTWLRMTQTFSGPAHGMHFPLHVGADVLIAHVEGDPDRPVIVGALPTPDTMTPVTQPNATQSVVRTRANIVFELEDDAS